MAQMQSALAVCAAILLLAQGTASAQDKGTLNPQPLPPLSKPPGPGTPAKELAARQTTPSAGPARSIRVSACSGMGVSQISTSSPT